MKLHFGHYIVIGMVSFMSFILLLSAKMINQRSELVAPDYYEKSMQHDQKQQKMANVVAYGKSPEVSIDDDKINIKFSSVVNGKVLLYRPSITGMDKEYVFADTDKFQINKTDLKNGYWKLKIEWKDSEREYYTEKDVVI